VATGTPEQKARVAALIDALPPERFPDARRFALLDPDAADRLIDRYAMLAGQPAAGRELLRAVLGDLRAARVSARKIEEFLGEVDGELRLRSRTAGLPFVAGAGLLGLLSAITAATAALQRRSDGDASIAAAIPTIERQLEIGASFFRAIAPVKYGGTLRGWKATVDAHDDGDDDSAVAPEQRGDGARAIAPVPASATSPQPDGDGPRPEHQLELFLDAAAEELGRPRRTDGDGLFDLPGQDVPGQGEGAVLSYTDPYVPVLDQGELTLRNVPEASVGSVDCAVVCTDHDVFDFAAMPGRFPLVVDTRNALKGVIAPNLFRL
jgi:hypothetical protein